MIKANQSSSCASVTTTSTVKFHPSGIPVSKESQPELVAIDSEHPDTELDRPLAIAIAMLYSPTPPPIQSARLICTHSLVTRVHHPGVSCQHCKKSHWFGWVYQCKCCSYSVCHNCRPKFVERSWESIWTMLNDRHWKKRWELRIGCF